MRYSELQLEQLFDCALAEGVFDPLPPLPRELAWAHNELVPVRDWDCRVQELCWLKSFLGLEARFSCCNEAKL